MPPRRRRVQLTRRFLTAIAPITERLECRRLLCTIGHDDSAIQEVHLYDGEGQHLNLSIPPDAAAVDVVKPSAKTPKTRTQRSATPETLTAVNGSLSGKVVYVNGGHGWTWNGSTWSTQRGNNNNLVEDFQTQDQITYYAQYLLNAGTTVVPIRPLGHQLSEIIIDNNDAAFTTPLGSWSTNTAASTYWSNTSGTDTANRYRFANVSATETAVARWTPNITTAGWYPVYAWWNNGSNRTSGATFRINSAGGSQEVKVNQRLTGKGWVYLGQYYFEAGTGGNVELSNKAGDGSAVIADAVRFGNGMGDWRGDNNPANPVSGKPREEELSLYWAYRSRGYTAANTIVSTTFADGGIPLDSDAGVGTPPRWSAYMNDETQGAVADRVFLSFHSNAFDGTARGALALTHSTPASQTPNQAWWANEIGNEVEEDMQALPAGVLEHTWASRSNTLAGAYGEISNVSANGEFSTTLLEVAFHDNVQDAQLMRNPKVRDWTARATYQSTVKYFNNFAGSPATLIPDPPTNIRTTSNAAGNVTLSWTAPGTGAANGGAGAATGYKIYTSNNGYAWSGEIVLGNVTSHSIAGLSSADTTYFRLVATNAGGESLQREVVAGKPYQLGSPFRRVLIVNGFDRFERTGNDMQSYSGGTTERVRLRYQNTRDYAIGFADAVEAADATLAIETAQNDQVISSAVNLGDYQYVMWISGEESTANITFDSTERSRIATYLSNGGKLFVSGAEIGADLVGAGTSPTFYRNTLKADYVSNDAATYSVTGVSGTAFAGVGTLTFDNGAANGASGFYDVETADVLGVVPESAVAMNYSTGTRAAVYYAAGNTRAVVMGFPFETITTAAKRNAVMGGVMSFFNSSNAVSVAPGMPDLAGGSDSGAFSADDVTNKNNANAGAALQFSVSGTVAGATVTIYADGVALGTVIATGATTGITTNGTLALANGVRNITARMTTPGSSISIDSPVLGVTIDTSPPTASSPPPGGPGLGMTFLDFNIQYGDSVSFVDLGTLDNNDITVTGPNGYSAAATFITRSLSLATYRIPAPGGTWDAGDSGPYTISQTANQVADIAGNLRAGGTLATHQFTPAFAWVESNFLHVQFLTPDNTVALTPNGSNTDVTQGGLTLSFASNSFAAFLIHGTSGDDTLQTDTSLSKDMVIQGGGGSDTLHVRSGAVHLVHHPPPAEVNLNVDVDAGASLVMFGTNLASLTVDGLVSMFPGWESVLVTKALSIGPAGKLDLADNDLVLDYDSGTPLGSVAGWIASGRAGGDWNGPGIFTSQADALFDRTTLGVAEAADIFGMGPGETTVFSGVTVDSTAILVKYTYAGDANLDGTINADDYASIDYFARQPGSSGYNNGDFNHDGVINADDFSLIDYNNSAQGSPL